jgi:very-short-patch-repair endonuclease
MHKYNHRLKSPARYLRSSQTLAELALWQRLRRKQIAQVQFYRQRPLLNFIVDFYCPKANLIIECDGSQHFTTEGLAADENRDAILADLGLLTLRFDNRQILQELEAVCVIIEQVTLQRIKAVPNLNH